MVFFGNALRQGVDEREARAAAVANDTRTDTGTRSRVLQSVTSDGPITAAELAVRFGLTPAAVRRHLDALEADGAIEEHEPVAAPRGRGRPARAYVVAQAGHAALATQYDSLAVDLLHYLQKSGGEAAVAAYARSRAEAVEASYAAQLAEAGLHVSDPAARAQGLVDLLNRDGYSATARPVGAGGMAGVQVCQGHCPVQQVAEEFPAFCEAEADMFSRLLDVHVQRLATLAGGDHVCTTFIPMPLPSPGTDQITPETASRVRADDGGIRPETSPVPTDHEKEGTRR